ncbi:hypothetical protein GCM10022246_18550 [Pedobacter ginsengiterrae]|uniref:Uncharacterized protein n=1 Tax=Pedobacter ginsengiterrae TaxID=871696 RepID=A0ABP7PI11_9SPHI|nr:hypothetical protein [Pedobacter aquatilis]
MDSITPYELAQVAEKLEKLLKNFNITLKVGLPNVIALSLPEDIIFRDEKAMQDFASQSLNAAGIHLYAQLEMVFISANQNLTTIILQGTPRDYIN